MSFLHILRTEPYRDQRQDPTLALWASNSSDAAWDILCPKYIALLIDVSFCGLPFLDRSFHIHPVHTATNWKRVILLLHPLGKNSNFQYLRVNRKRALQRQQEPRETALARLNVLMGEFFPLLFGRAGGILNSNFIHKRGDFTRGYAVKNRDKMVPSPPKLLAIVDEESFKGPSKVLSWYYGIRSWNHHYFQLLLLSPPT